MMSSATEFRYLGIGLGILICCLGALGNILAIAAYISNKKMRTPFNFLVANLAAADFIISTVILPIIIYGYFKMEWFFLPETCPVFAYFYYASRYTTSVFLVAISLNRYMHIVRPQASYQELFSDKRQRIICVISWSISLIFLLPLLFTEGFGWWEEGLLCVYSRKNEFANIYSLAMRMLFQLVPLVCMTLVYSRIYHIVRKTHAIVDNPKITVDGCSSFQGTNGTYITPSTSPRSPIGPCQKRIPFRRKTSCDVTSPSTKITGIPGSSPDKPEDTKSWNFSGALKPENGCQQSLENTVTAKQSCISENCEGIAAEKQVLDINLSSIEKVTTHAGSQSPQTERTSSKNSTNSSRSDLTVMWSRSVTLSSNNTSLKTSESMVSLDEHADIHTDYRIALHNDFDRRRPTSLYIPRRPNDLDVAPFYSPQTAEQKKLSRLSTLSLPISHKTKHISDSISDIIDFATKKRRSTKRKSAQHAKAQRKLFYMCAVICTAYALCSLPSVLVNLVAQYKKISSELHMAMYYLTWLTSMINPVVYAAMNVQYRREYCRLYNKMMDNIFGNCTKKSQKVHPTRKPANSIFASNC